MRTFIWVEFILCVLSAVCYLIVMGISEYPRQPSKMTAFDDALKLVFTAAFAVWAFFLLMK